MPNSSPAESLAKLRADLKHFEESGDLGENRTVKAITEHLLRRIAEQESAVRRVKELESAAASVPPDNLE